MNPKQRPVTDETREQVRQLHAQKLSRNEIARQMNRSGRTISIIAAELGLSFDRTATEEATRARAADLAERRVILAEALQGDAEQLTARMWEPAKVFNIGGKDNTYTDQDVDEPPADAKKALMAAAGMAIDRSLRLVPAENDGGLDAARSMLGALADGIRRVTSSPGEETPEEG